MSGLGWTSLGLVLGLLSANGAFDGIRREIEHAEAAGVNKVLVGLLAEEVKHEEVNLVEERCREDINIDGDLIRGGISNRREKRKGEK